MSLQMLTTVYGDKHIDIFQRACLKSLAFKRNKAALYEAKAIWMIFSEEKYFDHIRKIVDAFLPEFNLQLRPMSELRGFIDPVQSALVLMIEECLRTNSRLLMCPPDTIFGDGSVHGLLKVGREQHTCVVAAHARVLPSILDEDFSPYLTNAELVTMAWKHLHRSWSEASVGHPVQNSFIGGVSWQEIGPSLFAVQHRLPTVYLADFTEEDLHHFKTCISSGDWDHVWPGTRLTPHGRQRYIGGSDIAFMVEITAAEKNVPPMGGGPPDGFWRNHPHNEFNKQFSAVFRGG